MRLAVVAVKILRRLGSLSLPPRLIWDAFKPQLILRKIPVALSQGRARFVLGSQGSLAGAVTSSDLAIIDKAIRTMKAPRSPETYRAEMRLAAAGSGDSHGKGDFIDGVITM